MSDIGQDLAAARDLLVDVLISLVARFGHVHVLPHRAQQALASVQRLQAAVDEHEDLERSGAS